MRLFCDEMLRRLGRCLRAAGYDTAIAEGGARDGAILARCAEEDRVLLTRDRRLAVAARGKVPAVLLAHDALDQQALAVREALKLDWCHALFTRCLLDNTPLVPAGDAEIERMPPNARASAPLRVCPRCGRIYWRGGHVRRMAERLAAWH